MVAVNYVWDPFTDNITKEMDDAGNVIASYNSKPELHGDLISQKRDGTTSVYHYDGQRSTLALTDDNGDVTDTYEYNAFGETTTQTGTTVNPYRYIGQKGYQYNEETDDYYVRARTYEPTIARWTSVDPIGFNGSKWNLYQYVQSNPLIYTDPSGKIALCGTATVNCPVGGNVEVPVYSGSTRAARILALAGSPAIGCVTFLTAIHCTMSCTAIKTTMVAIPPPKIFILEHEACHYCKLKEIGKGNPNNLLEDCYGLIKYILSAGPAPDGCVGNERPAKAHW